MMGFGLLLPIVLIVVLAYALGWLPARNESRDRQNAPGRDALEILRQRYARGEIDREEFEHMRDVLERA